MWETKEECDYRADDRDRLWDAWPRACGEVRIEMGNEKQIVPDQHDSDIQRGQNLLDDNGLIHAAMLQSGKRMFFVIPRDAGLMIGVLLRRLDEAQQALAEKDREIAELKDEVEKWKTWQATAAIAKERDEAKEEITKLRAALAVPEVYAGVVTTNLEMERDRLAEELAQLRSILDRPLADDANVLLNLAQAGEPLSLAEQRDLYAWLEERDELLADADDALGIRDNQISVFTERLANLQAIYMRFQHLDLLLSEQDAGPRDGSDPLRRLVPEFWRAIKAAVGPQPAERLPQFDDIIGLFAETGEQATTASDDRPVQECTNCGAPDCRDHEPDEQFSCWRPKAAPAGDGMIDNPAPRFHINEGVPSQITPLVPQGTNSTMFTECCSTAICDDELTCPRCGRTVVGHDATTDGERRRIRWQSATRYRTKSVQPAPASGNGGQVQQ